ncbi:MAG: QueT transporter family protein [Lachnospiraceae bacterium]|nr:QueT transporter family protein [Lachnospiraceae bacterium]
MNNKKVLFLTQAAVIAAVYVVLTFLTNSLGLASGTIQVRLSELMTILPFFTPAAIPGLALGCLLANLLTGCIIYDVIFGSIATLLGAVGTWMLRKHPVLCTIPPVLANMAIVPFVLRYAYGFVFEYQGMDLSIPFYMLTVGIGEIICCCLLGSLLLRALNKHRSLLFHNT